VRKGPDIDSYIYVLAFKLLAERRRLALTMFLTPKAEPFWGGTYFPKGRAYGRPAFVTVLKTVAQAFHAEPTACKKNTKSCARGLR